MGRAIWKGSIAFGLVQIPVGLQPAEEPNQLSFDLLDRRDFSTVGYERVNKRTGKKVDWAQIVKGYKHSNGKYVVLTDADFEAANVEATHTIEIDRIVEASEVDPMYFERPYYVVPDKQGKKAYALLRDALERSGKIGIARVVIRTRQHLAALMPRDELLILVLLRFEHELRRPEAVSADPKKLGIKPKEREMAKALVESMYGKWDPSEYKDEYQSDLLSLIKDRVKRGQVNTVPEKSQKKRAAPRPAQVIDLLAMLQESVRQKSNDGPRRTRGVKRAASSSSRKARARSTTSLRKQA